MSIKLSHSGAELYELCPRKYFLQNIERILPKAKSSALFLGVSLDLSFNDILLNIGKPDYQLFRIGLKAFNKSWKIQEDKYLGSISLPKNIDIIYSKKDFEEGLLTPRDGEKIESYFQEILPSLKDLSPNIEYPFTSGYELFNHLRGIYKSFKYFNDIEKSFYNYVVWLSLKRKAPYLIKAYIKELVPKIDKVISVQDSLSLESEGDFLTGIADFVCTLKPGTYNGIEIKSQERIISDNKSSGKLYSRDSVELSSQLGKYKHILNENPEMKIDKGAYFVVIKELKQIKNKTCKSCGYQTVGQAKTCDNKPNEKKRCGGEWVTEVSFEAQTQLVVDHIPESTIDKALIQINDTILNIKAANFEPKRENCLYQFGQNCQYLDYCENGSMNNLVKVRKK